MCILFFLFFFSTVLYFHENFKSIPCSIILSFLPINEPWVEKFTDARAIYIHDFGKYLSSSPTPANHLKKRIRYASSTISTLVTIIGNHPIIMSSSACA